MRKTKKQTEIRLTLSSAEQWLNCPGVLDFKTGKNPWSNRTQADIGVDFHNRIEQELVAYRDAGFPTKANPVPIEDPVLDEWMQMSYNKVKSDCEIFADRGTRHLFLEQELEYRYKNITIVGRADAVLVAGDTMIVYDFKTGMKPVPANGNEQLLVTAYLMEQKLGKKFETVLGVIIQPSLSVIEQAEIHTHEMFFDVLDARINQTTPRQLVLGGHCRYCQVADICPKFTDNLKQYLDPTYLDTTVSRPEKWAEILEFAKPIIKVLESMQANALSALQDGISIPGYVIDKRGGRRQWNHNMAPYNLGKWLGLKESEVTKVSLESPAVLEKIIKQKFSGDKLTKVTDKFNEIVSQPDYFYAKRVLDGDMFQAKKQAGKKTSTGKVAKPAKKRVTKKQ